MWEFDIAMAGTRAPLQKGQGIRRGKRYGQEGLEQGRRGDLCAQTSLRKEGSSWAALLTELAHNHDPTGVSQISVPKEKQFASAQAARTGRGEPAVP